jgi:acyl-CoA reductase-like NAD-dependent aldehyde dehydrogenase
MKIKDNMTAPPAGSVTAIDSQSAPRWPEGDSDREFKMLIDGEWVTAQSGETFSCVDPFTEESWGQVPIARAADVDRAVRAARRAFDEGGWPLLPPAERGVLLRRLGQRVEENADVLARQQIHENGKLISEMLPGAFGLASDCYFMAGLAETVHGMTAPSNVPGFVGYTVREPIGVVAAITPWNSPLNVLSSKLLPALAAGNTVVVKPSEVTPTSTLLLGELILDAGFPRGVVNVITGFGDAGGDLVDHPGVDRITFTGSTAIGRVIGAAAAQRCARVSLELGGKSPNIVFADADLDNAVNGIMAGIFSASGQTCVAGSRVLIESSVYDEVQEMLVTRARSIRLGDPLDPDSQMGPLASRDQLERVLEYLETGKEEGMTLLTGGGRSDRHGFFVDPTVFGDVDNSCRLAREEIFGPVACLMRFEDEDDAVRIANETQYGLAAGVWTEDVRRAHRMISRLRAGMVWVNHYRMGNHCIPFGGFKQSGIGREMGLDALNEYTEMKSVWIDTGNKIKFATG